MPQSPEELRQVEYIKEIGRKLLTLIEQRVIGTRAEFDTFVDDIRTQIEADKNPLTGQNLSPADKETFTKVFAFLFGDPARGEAEGKFRKYLRIISSKATAYGDKGETINDLFVRAKEAVQNAGLGSIDHAALAIAVGISASELIDNRPEAKLDEKFSFEAKLSPLMQTIWQEYKTYKAQRNAAGADTADDYFTAPGGVHDRLGQPLPGGGQWTNPDVRKIFRRAYEIDSVLDRGMAGQYILPELNNVKQNMRTLKIDSSLSATGVSQAEVIFNRLKEKYDSYSENFLAKIDAQTIDGIAANLAASGEDAEFREFATGLNRLKKKLELLQERGVSLHNMDDADRDELRKLYEVVKSRQKFLTDADIPELQREILLFSLYRQLTNNAEAILGIETEELDNIFTDDVKYWLLGKYGQEWQEVQRYWALKEAGNTALLTEYDRHRLEKFAENLKQAFGELQSEPTKDVAYTRRFIAIDILLNRIDSILTSRASSVVPESDGLMEISGRAPYDEQSWRDSFEAALGKLPKEQVIRQLEWEMSELDRRERAYDQRERFAKSSEGVRFTGLKKWLDEKASRTGDEDYKYWVAYFSNRLPMADMMGPYAASNRMTANVRESVKTYPEYAHWNHDFFIGTKPSPENLRYKHYELVRKLVFRIEELLTEQWDFVSDEKVIPEKPKSTPDAPGFFSLGRSAWMGGEGDFHKKLYDKLEKEFSASSGLSLDELKVAIRVAFSGLTLTGVKAELFMSYYAVGSSPPSFAELGYEIEAYPQANDFNLAAKAVTEIPEVVMGMHVDRRWLLKMAAKVGVYAAFRDWHLKKDDPNKDKLWGLSGAPHVRDTAQFKDFIDKMDEDEADRILEIIREDTARRNNATYTRFRNLLRSIALSEAKCAAIHHYYDSGDRKEPKRRMKLLNELGVEDDRGDFLAPIVMTARIMIYGGTELGIPGRPGYFAEMSSELHEGLFKSHEVVVEFRKHIFSPAPELKGGMEHHHEDIAALAADWYKVLSYTSGMKVLDGGRAINWPKVLELMEYRLHVLFATYRAAGYLDPYQTPLLPISQEIQHRLKLAFGDKPTSLIETLKQVSFSSGQTMGKDGDSNWMNIYFERIRGLDKKKVLSPDEKEELFEAKAYQNATGRYVTLQQYLMELVEPRFGVTVVSRIRKDDRSLKERKRDGREEKALATKLDDGIYSGGLESRGYIHRAMPATQRYIALLRRYNVDAPTLSEKFIPVGNEKAKAEQKAEQQQSEETGKK